MFSFLKSNTYTVDGLKHMRSSILTQQARFSAKLAQMENTLEQAKTDAINGRLSTIERMTEEVNVLEKL